MSNPGVCTLVEFQLNGQRFCIEDNIGEAIHIHYGHFRVDLTVEEFLTLADDMLKTLNDIIKVDGLDINQVDPLFLFEISSYLPELQSVKMDKIKLSDLQVDTLFMGTIPVIRGIGSSRIVAALRHNTEENDIHKQQNLLFQNNSQRLESVRHLIENNDYPYDGKYIILFNNQNIIRDGQHRAGCMYIKDSNREIEIQRFIFKNSMYNISMHPWFGTLFVWTPRRLLKSMRKIKRICEYTKVYGVKRGLYSIGFIRCIWQAIRLKK